MQGEYSDFLVYPNGERVLIGSGQNLVVNSAYVVMAMCMKQDPAYGGFLYWAVGDGNVGAGAGTAAWDAGVAGGTIAPLATATTLLNEIYRKAVVPADITFIDGAGIASGTPTNRLQILATFLEDEPGGGGDFYLREFGLFGGTATLTADSGYQINHKVHATYVKNNLARLERRLRFRF